MTSPTRRALLAQSGAALACLFGAGAAAQGRPLTIFAAASLREALEEIAGLFVAAGGARPVLAYAGSNQLARQIEQGAPADLFLSADEEWMDFLVRRGLIRDGSRRNLLGNSLVLVGPAGAPQRVTIDRNLDLAALLKGGRLAMPDPNSVPAGRYAKAALEHFGLFANLRNKIAASENVRVALAYVARDEAPFGIVYATDAAAEPKVQIIGAFPKESHPTIIYPVAITSSASHPDAPSFLSFLGSAPAIGVFEKRGFIFLR
jgi:molybdate transport system substrate-binding protein